MGIRDSDDLHLRAKPHPRFPGILVVRGNNGGLATPNMVVGESVYGEERFEITGPDFERVEYRMWNPWMCKLAAAVVGGIESIHIQAGSKVLFLGGNRISVSHISDIVGAEGLVCAVECSNAGNGLIELSEQRSNIVPILADARHPDKFKARVPTVDCIVVNVCQPDQAKILALNAQFFLKDGGHFVIVVDVECIDTTVHASAAFASEVVRMKNLGLTPREQLTLEPFRRNHAVIVGSYSEKYGPG